MSRLLCLWTHFLCSHWQLCHDLLQNYIKQMAADLQATNSDMDTPEGFRLRQVVDEYSCIHAIASRVDPAGHMALVANAVNAYAGHSSAPNYREAVVMLLQTCSGSHLCCLYLACPGLHTRLLCVLSADIHSIPVVSARRMVHFEASHCSAAYSFKLLDQRKNGHSKQDCWMCQISTLYLATEGMPACCIGGVSKVCIVAGETPFWQLEFVVQPLMQFTVAQEVRLLAMRHIFITQLGLITQRRQHLAQQLHNVPKTVGISKEEMLHSHLAREACLQHLQECQALERKLFVQYMIAVCHGVRDWLCLL